MRAVTIDDGTLTIAEHPDPEPGAGEVLVRVRGAGLNGADILQRKGGYPAPAGSGPTNSRVATVPTSVRSARSTCPPSARAASPSSR